MRTRNRYRLIAGMAAAVLLASVTGVVYAQSGDNDAVVVTDNGKVRGTADDGYRSFKGVPYAAPPVDQLRWQSPQPAQPWSDVRDATESGAPCAQFQGNEVGIPSKSEDCLYLDVYAPEKAKSADLPVMVWIHGGSHLYGAGSMYDAKDMAARGEAIVVTVNYRLGAFGSLAHKALDETKGTHSSGNYGLQDQQAALKWVESNAEAFGGDSSNVTAMGESAGGYDVCAHLTSKAAAGLIDRAVIQSAPCGEAWATPREKGQQQAATFADEVGCGDADDTQKCLRGTDVDAILSASEKVYFETGTPPVVGGPLLPVDTSTALQNGDFNKIPVMQGINKDEWQLMVAGEEIFSGDELQPGDYPEALAEEFGDDAPKVEAKYRLSDYENPSKALAAALSDQRYALPALRTSELLAEHTSTFAYDFAERDTPWFTTYDEPNWSTDSYHMAEVAYLFDVDFIAPLNEKQRRIGQDMVDYWTAFAQSGDPDHHGAVDWKPFAADGYTQRLASGKDGIGGTDFVADHHVKFWKSLAA